MFFLFVSAEEVSGVKSLNKLNFPRKVSSLLLGLLSGCSVAAKAMCPDVRIIGVEPEAGNDTQQSLLAGEVRVSCFLL